MNKNVLRYINQLEGYKTAIKSLHWNASNMSEHKLWDDIADSVAGIQDNVSEMEQGINGQIQLKMLSPINYNISSKMQTLSDMLQDTKTLYDSLQDNKEYIGIRSELESFMGELNKYKYLLKIAIKEHKNRKNRIINEKINNIIKRNILKEFKSFKYNTPDEVAFADKKKSRHRLTYSQNNAMPFIYFADENKLFIGAPGSLHITFIDSLPQKYYFIIKSVMDAPDNNNNNNDENNANSTFSSNERYKKYYGDDNKDDFDDEYEEYLKWLNDGEEEEPSYSRDSYDYLFESGTNRYYKKYNQIKVVFGRAWVIDEDIPNVSCVISVWNMKKYIPLFVEQICEELNVDYFQTLICVGNQIMYAYDMDEFEPDDEEVLQQIQAIHLADQKVKDEFFQDFKTQRDAYKAKKAKEEGWGNATQAEINFWKNKGLDEAIEHKIKQKLDEEFRPDWFNYDGEQYAYYQKPKDKNYVFVIYDDGELLISDEFETHFDLIQYDLGDDLLNVDYSTGEDAYENAVYDWLGKHCCGRVFKRPNKTYSCIITCWNFHSKIKEYYKEICERINVDYKNAIYLNGDEVVWLYYADNYKIEDIPQNDELRAIHLADQKAKREFYKQFKFKRDEYNSKKAKEEGWGNATQAEINFWKNKGLDENKKKISSQ